jgi:ArsR family transcriptional regulator
MNKDSYTLQFAAFPIDEMSAMLKIASDPTRLKILCCLLDGKICVKELQNKLQASQSLISHQLRVLKDAKLVSFEKMGTTCFYILTDDHVTKLISVVAEHVLEREE